eukprot:165806-Chlamydomonas_euryale.AAC.4
MPLMHAKLYANVDTRAHIASTLACKHVGRGSRPVHKLRFLACMHIGGGSSPVHEPGCMLNCMPACMRASMSGCMRANMPGCMRAPMSGCMHNCTHLLLKLHRGGPCQQAWRGHITRAVHHGGAVRPPHQAASPQSLILRSTPHAAAATAASAVAEVALAAEAAAAAAAVAAAAAALAAAAVAAAALAAAAVVAAAALAAAAVVAAAVPAAAAAAASAARAAAFHGLLPCLPAAAPAPAFGHAAAGAAAAAELTRVAHTVTLFARVPPHAAAARSPRGGARGADQCDLGRGPRHAPACHALPAKGWGGDRSGTVLPSHAYTWWTRVKGRCVSSFPAVVLHASSGFAQRRAADAQLRAAMPTCGHGPRRPVAPPRTAPGRFIKGLQLTGCRSCAASAALTQLAVSASGRVSEVHARLVWLRVCGGGGSLTRTADG